LLGLTNEGTHPFRKLAIMSLCLGKHNGSSTWINSSKQLSCTVSESPHSENPPALGIADILKLSSSISDSAWQ
jgi:hypothetical protein